MGATMKALLAFLAVLSVIFSSSALAKDKDTKIKVDNKSIDASVPEVGNRAQLSREQSPQTKAAKQQTRIGRKKEIVANRLKDDSDNRKCESFCHFLCLGLPMPEE